MTQQDVQYWNQYYGLNLPQFNLANSSVDVYDDTKIEVIGHAEMQLEAEIGRGSYCKVFKGRWRNLSVATKRFTVDINEERAKEYIDNSAMKVNKQSHENVVKILAVAYNPFTLVIEYMNKGSVKNYIQRSRPGSASISVFDRIEIALQVAKGINHLHKLGIIHTNLTCKNLLMEINNKNDIRVVITDYGNKQFLNSVSTSLKWMAPELIENSENTSFESDIYAFGITLWEIITGQEPYSDIDPVDTAIHVLINDKRPQLGSSYSFIPNEIQDLMKLCWHKNMQQRPNSQKVVEILMQIVYKNEECLIYGFIRENKVNILLFPREIVGLMINFYKLILFKELVSDLYDNSEAPKKEHEQKIDLTDPNLFADVYDDTKIEEIGHVEIQLEAEIGKGCNSKVFKARWRNLSVAAKRFTVDINKQKCKKYIDNIAMKVNQESHENVIKILAVAYKPFTLLTEYMNKCSVKNYIKHNRPGSAYISILDRIKIALQAAKGITHLHKLGIIHGRISCRNLLMELKSLTGSRKRNNYNIYNIDDIRVIVTDYGLQQLISNDEFDGNQSMRFLKWMAPELIEDNNRKGTFEADIYAFGITMWEIITGEEPYLNINPVDTAIHVLVKESRPQLHEFIPNEIQKLMELCWHQNANERPTAQRVVQALTQLNLKSTIKSQLKKPVV